METTLFHRSVFYRRFFNISWQNMKNVFHIVQFSFVDNKQAVHWAILFRTKDSEGEIPLFYAIVIFLSSECLAAIGGDGRQNISPGRNDYDKVDACKVLRL